LAQILRIDDGTIAARKHYASITAVAFNAAESHVATGDAGGLVIVSELATGNEIVHLQHYGQPNLIAISPDGRYIAISTDVEDDLLAEGADKHVLHVWLLRTKDLLPETCQRLESFVPTKDSSRCVKLSPTAE
jgi:WD40 repeat protein